jgi:hypothetical protein
MEKQMKKFILSLIFVLAFSVSVFAQSESAINNSVAVSAGVTRIDSVNLFSGQAEIRKGFMNRFVVTDSFTVTDNNGSNTGQVIGNTAAVRGYINKFFVGGGASVSKLVNVNQDTDFSLNPVIQAGATFENGRLTLEPAIQLMTPDVLSDNPSRSLGGSLTGRVAVTPRFGVSVSGGVAQLRSDNKFFTSNGTTVSSGSVGVYLSF